MSSTRVNGCSSRSCAAVTTSDWMPTRFCIATLRYMRSMLTASSPLVEIVTMEPVLTKPQSPPISSAQLA